MQNIANIAFPCAFIVAIFESDNLFPAVLELISWRRSLPLTRITNEKLILSSLQCSANSQTFIISYNPMILDCKYKANEGMMTPLPPLYNSENSYRRCLLSKVYVATFIMHDIINHADELQRSILLAFLLWNFSPRTIN